MLQAIQLSKQTFRKSAAEYQFWGYEAEPCWTQEDVVWNFLVILKLFESPSNDKICFGPSLCLGTYAKTVPGG